MGEKAENARPPRKLVSAWTIRCRKHCSRVATRQPDPLVDPTHTLYIKLEHSSGERLMSHIVSLQQRHLIREDSLEDGGGEVDVAVAGAHSACAWSFVGGDTDGTRRDGLGDALGGSAPPAPGAAPGPLAMAHRRQPLCPQRPSAQKAAETGHYLWRAHVHPTGYYSFFKILVQLSLQKSFLSCLLALQKVLHCAGKGIMGRFRFGDGGASFFLFFLCCDGATDGVVVFR